MDDHNTTTALSLPQSERSAAAADKLFRHPIGKLAMHYNTKPQHAWHSGFQVQGVPALVAKAPELSKQADIIAHFQI
jgi:hypothetical protein